MFKTLSKRLFKLLVGDDFSVDMAKVKSVVKLPTSRITERELLARESEIGARLFGEASEGHLRSFFCLDENTWIWHEEWRDKLMKRHATAIRYEVSPQGILKVQEGAKYSYIEGHELENFGRAVQKYYTEVARQVYNRPVSA